jgi:DNA-binding response OmpR family regulator
MKKILVVDDDQDLLTALKAVLLRKGYDVTVALSIEEGTDILHSLRPDYLLLDIYVGAQDGRQMCRKLKEQTEYEHTTIILMSASREALKLYKNYKADAILKKPFSLESLSESMHSYK